MPQIFTTKQSYDDTIANYPKTLVYFYADWCTTCIVMNNTISKISKQYKHQLHLIKINIDSNKILIDSLHIPAVPALHLYQNKKIGRAFLGYISKRKLQKQLNL